MATWSNLRFQNSSSPLIEELIFFHDHIIIIIIIIIFYVGYLIILNLNNKLINRLILDHDELELIWTVVPGIILLFLIFPSLRILYLLDEINKPTITLKVIGHQWYWRYEYSDFLNIKFDSYIIPQNEIELNNFRLLDVDNRIIIPVNTQIRILVSAADVLHAWTVPALGVKVDATPGRLNQTNFFIYQSGLFFGQCSEICGANHRFMPIVIERITPQYFIKWIKNFN